MINIEQTFTPRVNPADTDYPFGSIKDNTSPGANDGTPLSAVWGNDFEGFRQAAMTEAGITPSGLPDTAQDSQLLDAVKFVANATLRDELADKSGSSLVGTQITTNASIRTVAGKLKETVSLFDFHCDASGNPIAPSPSVDSRPYIQNAIDYLASIGGGTLNIPKLNGNAWYLGSFGAGGIAGHTGIIQLKNNVDLCIEGKIQLSPFFSGKAFQVFVGFDNADPVTSSTLSNCHIYGGGILDFGGVTMPSGGALRNGVTFGKSYNCSMRHMILRNGDMTWGATIGWNGYGLNTVIEDVVFDNLILTANNPDHSTIYVGAPHCGVNRCTFTSTNERAALIACTVELHQHDTWYTNSSFSGYTRGCYVVMHVAESAGAGNYLYNANVSGNTGSISGQFVVFSSDLVSGIQGHVVGCTVSGNTISLADGFQFGSFVDIAPTGSVTEVDVTKILVTGNTYTAHASAFGSAVMTVNATLNGITFSNNYFDTRTLLRMAGPTVGVATCTNFVWDESNTLGPAHSGSRAGLNLLDMQFASVTNSNITLRLASEDTSMYSGILFPSGCVLSFSTIKMLADFTGNMTNTIVFEGNQQAGANVYAEYPTTISFTSYNATGAVAFFSTSASYSWVTHAYPLTSGGDANYNMPAAWTSKFGGQLWGIGFNEVGAIRTGDVRLMVQRKV